MNKSFVRCYMYQLLVSNVFSFTPSIVEFVDWFAEVMKKSLVVGISQNVSECM